MTQASLISTSAEERYGAVVPTLTGMARKEAGQQAAFEAECAEWRERTLFLFKVFMTQFRAGDLFAMEDFRAYADTCNHPGPHTHKVWGSMPAYFIKHGCRIRRTDRSRLAKSPRTHGHPVTLWEVLVQPSGEVS